MIEGVQVIPLKQILDERGKVMHMLRCDAPHFLNFGEIYFSFVYPGAIKAWHLHETMVLNYAVPFGNIKLVIYDGREESATYGKIQEIFLGADNYNLVVIPAMVWNGFKGIGTIVCPNQDRFYQNNRTLVIDAREGRKAPHVVQMACAVPAVRRLLFLEPVRADLPRSDNPVNFRKRPRRAAVACAHHGNNVGRCNEQVLEPLLGLCRLEFLKGRGNFLSLVGARHRPNANSLGHVPSTGSD